MKKKSGSGLAAMAAIIMLATLRAGAAPWVLIDATTNNGSFETPVLGPTNNSGYNATYDVYWLWATPTSWDTLGGNALIETKGTLCTGVTGNQFAILNSTGPWLAKTFSETYQTGSVYTLTADIGGGAVGLNVGIYFKGMQGTSEVASLGQTVTTTDANALHPMTNLVLDTAAHPEFIGKTIRVGFNLPGSGQGFVDNVTLQYVSLCNNQSFELGVTVPTNGMMAIPYWTQEPYPSGHIPAPYMTGLSATNGLCDNGLIPDGMEVADIEVYSTTVRTNTLKQTINGFSSGTVYQLQYYENARANPAVQLPVLTVNMNGAVNVAPHVVTNVDAYGVHSSPFIRVKGAPFLATSNSMTLAFVASQLASGDNADVFMDMVSFSAYTGGPVVQNPSFELGVNLASSGAMAIPFWTQTPYPSGWPGSDYLSGTATNGIFDNGINPDGPHVAFIELYSTVSTQALHQTVAGFTVGKTYQVQFYENSRAYWAPTYPVLTVTIDGVTNVAPHAVPNVNAADVRTQPFRLVKGQPFVATSPAMTLSFIAQKATADPGGDLLLDMVSIIAIPSGFSFTFH